MSDYVDVVDGDCAPAVQARLDRDQIAILKPFGEYVFHTKITVKFGQGIIGSGASIESPSFWTAVQMLGGFIHGVAFHECQVRISGSPKITSCTFTLSQILAVLAKDSIIQGNQFDDGDLSQVYYRRGCENNICANNVFCTEKLKVSQHVIDIESNDREEGSSHNLITGNSVRASGTPVQITGAHAFDNLVCNNVLENTSGRNSVGVKLKDCRENTIQGNSITAGNYGLMVSSGLDKIRNNTIVVRDGVGIRLGGGGGHHVQGNNVDSPKFATGVYSPNNVVVHNVFASGGHDKDGRAAGLIWEGNVG